MWWLAELAVIAQAQETGQLRVTVIDDEMELTIPGVRLELSGKTLRRFREQLTDQNGELLFMELPEGTYRLIASKDGFRKVTLAGIRVRAERTTHQELVLSLKETATAYT